MFMSTSLRLPPQLDFPATMTAAIFDAAASFLADQRRALHLSRQPGGGATVRPGAETPLWNTLVAEIRPHLRKYGAQARLGRLLGLPRQQVNAYFTLRTRMPDAERTLQLLAWLMATRQGHPPS